MPTGYTAELMEKGQDFPTFVMRCARAFGALITLRDESLDAPIPEKFEASSYSKDALERAKGQQKRLEAMSNDERIMFGRREQSKAIKSLKEATAKDEAENIRLDAMAEKVRAWQPPTTEHKELKSFMLEQIKISRHSMDYYQRRLGELDKKVPLDLYAEAVIAAERDITYHTDELRKDQERADGRTKWVEQLRSSLK